MIKIGKVIYNLLSNDLTVKGLIDDKIYPLVIPENTVLPVVVYERNFNIEYNSTNLVSTSTIDITILTEDYDEGINIASSIDGVLNGFKGTSDNIRVLDIKLNSGDETTGDNAYIQKLTYTIKAV